MTDNLSGGKSAADLGQGLDPQHVTWSRNLFNSLKDGGKWGVPRSGLMWEKRGNAFVLTDVMPWSKEMPITRGELKLQQDSDIVVISNHMRAAGVEVQTPGR